MVKLFHPETGLVGEAATLSPQLEAAGWELLADVESEEE